MPKFPTKLVLHFADGSTKEVPFKEPKRSPKGKLNANASGKLLDSDDRYQIGCNVTLCKPKKDAD